MGQYYEKALDELNDKQLRVYDQYGLTLHRYGDFGKLLRNYWMLSYRKG